MRNDFWPIVIRSIKDRWVVLAVYCVVTVLLLLMYVLLFPAIQEQAQQLKTLLETYPEGFSKAFNVDDSVFTNIEGFLSAEQFSFIWPIFLIVIVTSIGGGAIAGEIEKGTIELLLSQPTSRLKLFFAKYLAGVFNLVIFVVVSIYAIIPLAAIFNINYKIENFAMFSLVAFLFGLAIFSLAMFFSALFNQKGRVYFLTAGIVVLGYVANIVAALKDNLADIKYFSFFYYFDSTKILAHNQIDNLTYYVFIGMIVVFTIAGGLIFNRRDIAT